MVVLYNTSQITCRCTLARIFFFFSLEKFGCSVEIKLSKEIHKGRKGTKTPSPRRDNRRKQDCVLLGVVVVLLISRWGVHTAHDTYVPHLFSGVLQILRLSSATHFRKISEMCSRRLAFVILSQMAEFRFHFSLSYCLVFFISSILALFSTILHAHHRPFLLSWFYPVRSAPMT